MTDDTKISKGASTVVVGCKLPNGLICELGRVNDDNYQRVDLAGANSATLVGGFGITTGVSTAFWEAWKAKNKRLPFVQKGLVFAVGDLASANDHALDLSALKSGMERLNVSDVAKIAPGAEADLDHLKQGMKDGRDRARSMV